MNWAAPFFFLLFFIALNFFVLRKVTYTLSRLKMNIWIKKIQEIT